VAYFFQSSYDFHGQKIFFQEPINVRVLGFVILTLLIAPAIIYQSSAAYQEQTVYACPMHPEIKSQVAGICPRCEMKLEPVKPTDKNQPTSAATPTLAQPRELIPQSDGYTCTMHPDVRVSAPGKCPKCAMPLVAVAPAVTDEFDLRVECSPRAPKPNEKVRLRFTIHNPKTGEQVKNFQVLHEQLFHLFVISQDLTEFQHIHPEFNPDGSFTIETVLPRPGRYKIYSDFYPTDGTPQVLQQSIATAGYASDLVAGQAQIKPDTSLVKTADGIKVELKLEPSEIVAGQPVTLKYNLTDAKTGAAITDLTPYLGAWGHTLILSEDQSDYVHSHPEEVVPETKDNSRLKGGPAVTFEALMPRPGNYRIWSQFLRGGTLTTVSFTVRAERLR
jgi:Heavy metal binding domain